MLMGNASKILQTVSANIDRDVMEPALTGLSDLIMLTDTSGLLNGEEKISVQGVNVAIQRETVRQRQVEFLSATINPTDMRIVGLKGRGAVLRSVASTIGLNGEEIVPPDQVLEQMQAQQQQQEQSGPVMQQIQKGVQRGVEAGVQRITTELTAGEIAQKFQMPEGLPTHIGTPPGAGGQPQPATNNPAMDLGPGGDMAREAAVGQGTRRPPLAQGGLGVQSANTVSNSPGPTAKPLSPGPG
jgi:hypothetical protein